MAYGLWIWFNVVVNILIFLQSRMYGLLIGAAILVCGWLVSKMLERESLEKDIVWDGLVWVVGFGLVGARAYHVIDLWEYYSQNWFQVVAVWNGGLGIFGGLVGGVIGMFAYIKFDSNLKPQISNLKKYLDLVAIVMPLGQAIGRWGNYFNQELYGAPVVEQWRQRFPLAVRIEKENRLLGFENFEWFEPLFLYESLLNIGLFGLLMGMYLMNRKQKTGNNEKKNEIIGSGWFVGVYLVGYGVIRFLLEGMRLEMWQVGGVPTASLFAVGMMTMGIVFLVRSWTVSRKKKP